MKRIHLLIILTFLLYAGCGSQNNAFETVKGVFVSKGKPSSNEVAGGLKEALEKGVLNGTDQLSLVDGYFGNMAIKVLMPPEAQKVEKTLRDMGMGKLVDDAILSFNRAAEDAAKQAAPIFLDAITDITFSDAMNILLGDEDAATTYLKQKTFDALYTAYAPSIQNSLESVNATKYWDDVITRYNKIPFVKDVNPDLTSYVTEKALDGLFYMVEKEEEKIRDNVSARSTDLLKKVFGYADSQK